MFLEKSAFVFFILRKYINIKEAILWIKNACMKNMIENNTNSIRFETLDKLSTILDVPIGDLFEKTDETTTRDKKANNHP